VLRAKSTKAQNEMPSFFDQVSSTL